jgi:hypothetical protein
MATRSRRRRTPPSPRASSRKGKVRKEFWLDPKLLRTARELLGATTEREAVEMALDLVAFRQELVRGTRSLAGLDLVPLD